MCCWSVRDSCRGLRCWRMRPRREPLSLLAALRSNWTAAFDTADAAVRVGCLCWVAAFAHGGFISLLQKNPENEPVRDQQQRHDESRNEIGGSQLPRREARGVGLIEGIQQI